MRDSERETLSLITSVREQNELISTAKLFVTKITREELAFRQTDLRRISN
jgi:hypothetical protein